SPACPACPPLVLPDLPRVLPAMRGGFFMPSLDGGLLLLELFLSSCRRRSATSWRKAAFSIRKTSISRCSAEIRSRISGRRIIHTLTHTSPSRVPKNRGPSRSFTKTVANQTHPSLGVTKWPLRIFLLALRIVAKRASPGAPSFSDYRGNVGHLPIFSKGVKRK